VTHENMKTDTEYAVLNRSKKVVYKTNDEATARARRDKMDPAWTIVEMITTYREIL
jgi:hypothetical protein